MTKPENFHLLDLYQLILILTGLFLVNFFQPGVKRGLKEQLGFEKMPEEFETNVDKSRDKLLGIILTNARAAMAKGNVLPIIFLAPLFGFFISRSSEPYRKMLTDFFQGIFTLMMQITQFIIQITPVGVFAFGPRSWLKLAQKFSVSWDIICW